MSTNKEGRETRLSNYVRTFRSPTRVPQPAELLSKEQRDLDHIMRCQKVGCTRCQL